MPMLSYPGWPSCGRQHMHACRTRPVDGVYAPAERCRSSRAATPERLRLRTAGRARARLDGGRLAGLSPQGRLRAPAAGPVFGRLGPGRGKGLGPCRALGQPPRRRRTPHTHESSRPCRARMTSVIGRPGIASAPLAYAGPGSSAAARPRGARGARAGPPVAPRAPPATAAGRSCPALRRTNGPDDPGPGRAGRTGTDWVSKGILSDSDVLP